MHGPHHVPATLCATALLAAGCGSSPRRPAASRVTTTTAATTATAQTTAQAPKQSPARTLRDVRAALRGLRSYHVAGSQTDPQGTTSLAGDVTAAGDLRMTIHQHGTSADMIVIGNAVYLRAAEAFWTQSHISAQLAHVIADRWIKAPSEHGIQQLSDQVRPRTLAHCLQGGGDQLTDAGLHTYHGRPVRVLTSAGRTPGSSPGKLYVAATGPAFPLRVLQTGPAKPGGVKDPRCDDPKNPDHSTRSDIALSRFDEPVHVTAPPDALDLEALAADLSGTTPS